MITSQIENLSRRDPELHERDFSRSIELHPERPVVILAGDTWLSPPGRPSLVDRLGTVSGNGLSLLRLDEPGEELLQLVSGPRRRLLRRVLRAHPVDALLMSAGGNDFGGEELHELLRPRHLACPNGARLTPSHAFCGVRLERCMRQLLDALHLIADLRDEYRPRCVIVSHGYAYPAESDTSLRRLPPFGLDFESALDRRGYADETERSLITRFLIDRFNDVLESFAAIRSRVVHLDLRRAHPDPDGRWHPGERALSNAAASLAEALHRNNPARFRPPGTSLTMRANDRPRVE